MFTLNVRLILQNHYHVILTSSYPLRKDIIVNSDHVKLFYLSYLSCSWGASYSDDLKLLLSTQNFVIFMLSKPSVEVIMTHCFTDSSIWTFRKAFQDSQIYSANTTDDGGCMFRFMLMECYLWLTPLSYTGISSEIMHFNSRTNCLNQACAAFWYPDITVSRINL